jgi:hypothetical protein
VISFLGSCNSAEPNTKDSLLKHFKDWAVPNRPKPMCESTKHDALFIRVTAGSVPSHPNPTTGTKKNDSLFTRFSDWAVPYRVKIITVAKMNETVQRLGIPHREKLETEPLITNELVSVPVAKVVML